MFLYHPPLALLGKIHGDGVREVGPPLLRIEVYKMAVIRGCDSCGIRDLISLTVVPVSVSVILDAVIHSNLAGAFDLTSVKHAPQTFSDFTYRLRAHPKPTARSDSWLECNATHYHWLFALDGIKAAY